MDAVRRSPWPFLATVAVLVALWSVLHWLAIWPQLVFPGPLDVARSLARLARSGQLLPALESTFRRLGLSYALSLGLGGLIAAGLVLVPGFRGGVQPFLLALQSLPGLAWVPLALLWFGLREPAVLFVTVMGSVFSIAMGMADSFATVPPLYHKAARNMGVSGGRLLLRVTVPAATPHLLTAAKVGWSFAWRSLVGAEIIMPSVTVGLGFLLNQGRETFDVAQVFATMVVLVAIGVVIERVVFARLEVAIHKRWG
ncbi:MAG: sulfonate transport system permease protein, partial [Thermoplasmata archaeon]|nr:sulfonate transport system permease protein [Thermoplasmata archaeon]